MAVGVLITLIIAACIILRRATVAPEAVLAGVILLLLYAAVPSIMDGAPFAIRLSIMVGFLVFAGFAPRGLPSRVGLGLGLTLGVAFLVRIAFLVFVRIG